MTLVRIPHKVICVQKNNKLTMKVVVTGLRGFPNIQGGVETHCEELFPRLVSLGCSIIVVRRTCFVAENPPMPSYKGVLFKDLQAPKIPGFEAAFHTLKAVIYAFRIKADIIHIHAIGPSLVVPLAKLLGLKVVVTHHGPDYNRQKWNSFAKFILKTGEFFAARFADKIIVISTVIADILKEKYNRKDSILIYNGITTQAKTNSTNYLNQLGLKDRKYILAVGRFVEEKRFDKLIDAYKNLQNKDFKLVIAGDADHESPYSIKLKEMATKNGVILTGMIKGEKLAELYAHANLFVLPSSHEGLPITLLEAMSYELKVLASNIPANLAVALPSDCYFDLCVGESLVNEMDKQLNIPFIQRKYDLTKYNWDTIASQTLSVYKSICQE